jgi:membrane-bound acyltransferase YfiQ involved in biofilm formation
VNTHSRYFGIDIAKAISIFGVVYIHCGFSRDQFSSYAFRFGVPIFIIVSFFLSERLSIDKNIELHSYTFLRKRSTRLFAPFIFWTIFYALTDFLLGIKTSVEITPVFGWTGQYFFIVLLQLTLAYPLLRKLDINLRSLMIIMLTTLAIIYIPISYFRQLTEFVFPQGGCSLIFWVNYIALGIFFARNYDAIVNWLKKINLKHLRIPLIITCSLLLVGEQLLLSHFSSGELSPHPYTYSRVSVFVSSALIFLICLDFNQSLNMSPMITAKVTSLSKWSLGIFCLNPLIIDVFYILPQTSIPNIDNDYVLIGLRLVLSAVICILAILISRLISALGLKILVQ